MHCQYYALFQELYLFHPYINICIGSRHLILISSQYTKEITIKFQRKYFKGKVVRVDGFRPEFKAIYKEFQHRIDSVKDGDGYTDDCFSSLPLSYCCATCSITNSTSILFLSLCAV